MLKIIQQWDRFTLAATFLCVAATIPFFVDADFDLDFATLSEAVFIILVYVIGLPLVLLFVCAAQLVMLAAIRFSSSRTLKIVFLCVSVLMLTVWYRFALTDGFSWFANNDGFGMIFFPLYLGIITGVFAALVLGIYKIVTYIRANQQQKRRNHV